MKALVFIDPDTGVFVEWDTVVTFYVRTRDGDVITTFDNGRPTRIGRARKIAQRWMAREYPKRLSTHAP